MLVVRCQLLKMTHAYPTPYLYSSRSGNEGSSGEADRRCLQRETPSRWAVTWKSVLEEKQQGGSPEESPRRVNHQEMELFPTPPEGFSLGKRHADEAGLCIRSMANRLLLPLLKYPSLWMERMKLWYKTWATHSVSVFESLPTSSYCVHAEVNGDAKYLFYSVF